MSNLKTYCVEYDDGPDSGCPLSFWHTIAYSMEHAIEKFYDADDGFRPLRIAVVRRDKPSHRWRWIEVTR